MMKLFAVIVLLLAGCASVSEKQVSPQALENALDAQEKWLQGLERGQPIQEVKVAFVPSSQYSLEIFQHGQNYHYISGMYPITGTMYGLYFEAGRLKALMLGDDVTEFYDWEYHHRHNNHQWLASGMAGATGWVETRDVLGRDFDARATPRRGKTDAGDKTDAGNSMGATGGTSSGDSIEIITTVFFLSPILLAVAPVVLLSGGFESDDESASEKESAEREEAAARAASQRAQLNVGKLHPGTTTSDDMLRLMGPPEYKGHWTGGKVWAYDTPKIYIGTVGGIVIWKELGGSEYP